MKNLFRIALLTGLLQLLCFNAFSQLPVLDDTFRVNNVYARVQSNGAFFQGGESGMFLVPDSLGGAPSRSLMRSAGLWLAGRDPSGNLRLSAQLHNEGGKTDFYPGFLNSDATPDPEFNLIAKVSAAEVEAQINNPAVLQPGVYGWPAKGNSYFANYHGFDLPYGFSNFFAGFYDNNGDAYYEPDFGDYPVVALRGCPLTNVPDKLMWLPFHDVGQHTQTGGLPLHQGIQSQILGYDCPEGSPVDRVVYVHYRMDNRDTVQLDSVYFGVFLDFEIGNGGDDFIGCNPQKDYVFAYNGDDTDEGGFEKSPPVMAVSILRGPFNNDNGEELRFSHFVPVDPASLSQPSSYYNLLKGRKADGSAFQNNGLMYTGNPLVASQWSEVSAGNTPGERMALASFGPFTLYPGAVNEIILGYYWVRKYPNGSVADNLSILQATDAKVKDLYYNCFKLYSGCPSAVSVFNPDAGVLPELSPNPFGDQLIFNNEKGIFNAYELLDVTGKVLRSARGIPAGIIRIETAGLEKGIYLLNARTPGGQSAGLKLIHL